MPWPGQNHCNIVANNFQFDPNIPIFTLKYQTTRIENVLKYTLHIHPIGKIILNLGKTFRILENLTLSC